MVIGIKDIFKMLGIVIISACAVFVCTLFLNYNQDLKGIEDLIQTNIMQQFYDALLMTGKVVCSLSGGCLLLTSVVMLCFYIKHYIDTHRKELGILKALGYSNLRIASGFWVFGLNIFLGTALGYAGAYSIMPYFYSVQNKDHALLEEVTLHFHFSIMFYLVILPTIIFAIISVCYGYFKLGMPVLELLKGKTILKIRTGKKDTDLPFLKDLRKNTVRQRRTLVFFIAFASFCYSAMLQMSVGMEELASIMMSVIILLIGILLAFVTLFLAVTTIVRSNTKTMAMMRVFGYSTQECSKAILSGYRPAAYIGFAIGTVYQYTLLKIMVSVVFKDVENVPDYNFDVWAFIITLVSFVILYELIMYWYARKMSKVSIKEIMLDAD